MYMKHVITAGILSAALALGPGAAFAQTSGSSSGTNSPSSGSQSSGSQGSSTQGTTSSSTTSSSSSGQQQSGSGGTDQEAVRQHLTGAREALAELTKLPAAMQLQGDSRQRIAQFIGDFNSFATATTDWRSKYDAVDRELDQLIGADSGGAAAGAAAAAPSPSASGSTTGASSTTGTPSTPANPNAPAGSSASGGAVGTGGTGEAGSLDPTIVAKLREVRTHLDAFEVASGDPTFVVEKIEKILDQAGGGSASGAVGTSGSSAGEGGSITLSAAQVQELRGHLEKIKAAAKR